MGKMRTHRGRWNGLVLSVMLSLWLSCCRLPSLSNSLFGGGELERKANWESQSGLDGK